MLRLDLLLIDNQLWHDEVPRVMQGAVRLQSRGAWQTTIANAWGTLAVEKFARAFESVPVKGTTTASLAAVSQKLNWAHDPSGRNLILRWPPRQADLHVEHSGSGDPWVQIRARAAIPLKSPFSSGYRITRTLSAVDSNHGGGWRRGDIVRVHLKIDAQTDMTWVVVNDPLPAGASHLGTGLRRAPKMPLTIITGPISPSGRSTPSVPIINLSPRARSRSSTRFASIRPAFSKCPRLAWKRSTSPR